MENDKVHIIIEQEYAHKLTKYLPLEMLCGKINDYRKDGHTKYFRFATFGEVVDVSEGRFSLPPQEEFCPECLNQFASCLEEAKERGEEKEDV